MRLRELFEAAAPTVGRKYQHIEDLVFTNGSNGGHHAVERMRDMGTTGGSIELKWDGSPVVYWGRDEQGRFMLIPKNAWEYLKRGKRETTNGVSTLMLNPKDIENFILQTGKSEPGKEKQRVGYAKQLSSLWNYFESISPEKGFIEGGLLFYPGTKPQGGTAMPVLNKQTGNYDFTPNITSFHIPADSDLGKRIARAKVMVAATGYYSSLGDGSESRFPNAEELSTDDVIVQGTTYVQEAPEFDSSDLDEAEQYIDQNAGAIDSFLAGQPGLSKPGDVLYKFYNQTLRVEGAKDKFEDWVKQNISAGQAQKVLTHPGLPHVLTAVELLTKAKMKLITALNLGTHGGIKQTKPEGYAQAHPGRQFKRDLPGQFVKAIDQANWAPRKD